MSYLRNTNTLPTSKYATGTTHTIPARTGVAVPVSKDHTITITNTQGTQVVDTWFLSMPTESSPINGNPVPVPAMHMSMCHSRASNLHLSPKVGDVLTSNHRVALVRFEVDSSAEVNGGVGVHDTLIAACDINRYRELGVPEGEWHDSCAENFRRALRRDLGLQVEDEVSPPDPLNLWMNIPVTPNAGVGIVREGWDGVRNVSAGAAVTFERPVCKKGDFVVLRALVDGVFVMSACPQDILAINDFGPVGAAFRVD